MTETLFRRLLLRFALVPALSICLFLAVLEARLHSISVYRTMTAYATATLLATNHLFETMIDEENGVRGFLLTHDPTYLEPYRAAAARFDSQLQELTAVVAGDPGKKATVNAIARDFRNFDAINAALLQPGPPVEPLSDLLRKQKAAMERLRVEFAGLTAIESNSRDAARHAVNDLFRTLPALGIGGGVLVAFLLIWHGIYLFNEITTVFRRQLAESEAQRDSLHTMLQSIGDAVIVCDSAGRITLLNPTAEQLTGWSKAQAMGQPLDEVFHIIDEITRARMESPIASLDLLGSGVKPLNETLLMRKDGAEIPIDKRAAPMRNSRSQLTGFVLSFSSIAERKQAQDALRRSEERLRLALTAAEGVGIWDWDVPNDRVYAGAEFATLYGLNPEAGQRGTSVAGFTRKIHPDDREAVERAVQKALATGDEFSAEYRLLQADGSVRWVSAVGRRILGPDGVPARFPGVTVDITSRKETEQALRESEARFQAIYATTLEYIWILNPMGQLLDANRASLVFADSKREDVMGRPFWDGPWFAYTRGAAEFVRAAVSEVAGGKMLRTELPLRRPSGEWITFDFSLAPVLDAHGKVLFMVPEGRDISDLKRADEALRASEERLRIATETARLGTWELDLRTGYMQASGICREHFGRSPNDRFTYQDLLHAVHSEDRQRREAAVERAIENDTVYRLEYRAEWPDGSLHWILASGRAHRDAEGMNIRMIGVTIDVTERRQAEAALLQNEKLAAVGRLAATIAHEINNPLESVTNLLYLSRMAKNLPDIYAHLDLAERELSRVSVITTQTLRFHKQSTRMRPVTVDELFESVLLVYQGRLANDHVLLRERRRETKPILCFDGEIRQVLNNLVGNALDALESVGGSLFLRSREGTEWKTGRKGIVVTIADTGGGIPRKALHRIFDPFFTTKGASGTGLGLWVSKEIVDRHEGVLRVRSQPQPGSSWTVFTLFLPFTL